MRGGGGGVFCLMFAGVGTILDASILDDAKTNRRIVDSVHTNFLIWIDPRYPDFLINFQCVVCSQILLIII